MMTKKDKAMIAKMFSFVLQHVLCIGTKDQDLIRFWNKDFEKFNEEISEWINAE